MKRLRWPEAIDSLKSFEYEIYKRADKLLKAWLPGNVCNTLYSDPEMRVSNDGLPVRVFRLPFNGVELAEPEVLKALDDLIRTIRFYERHCPTDSKTRFVWSLAPMKIEEFIDGQTHTHIAFGGYFYYDPIKNNN